MGFSKKKLVIKGAIRSPSCPRDRAAGAPLGVVTADVQNTVPRMPVPCGCSSAGVLPSGSPPSGWGGNPSRAGGLHASRVTQVWPVRAVGRVTGSAARATRGEYVSMDKACLSPGSRS